MQDRELVIFGASGGAVKIARNLLDIGADFCFFIDNDKNKWGNFLEGKEIKAPSCLTEGNYNIVIASDYQPEIEEQLNEMGLLDHLVLQEEYVMRHVEACIDQFDYLKEIETKGSKPNIIFGLEEGMWLGGIETWTFLLSEEFIKRDYTVQIISKITEDQPPRSLQNNICYVDLENSRYWESIKDLVKLLSANLPCTVIDNWERQVLIAVSIIKRFHPDKIRCISVLHNDKVFLYRKTAYMSNYIDAIAGVSKDILIHMEKDFGIEVAKLHYKESPIEFEEDFYKKYTEEEDQPLQIGYAARITKTQKRSDLLIPLIEGLEARNIHYHLHIAGIGNYFDKLTEIIEQKELGKNVTLHGFIPRKEMTDFWKRMDAFINLSDYEGVGLSMLEAMSYGAVPIVTDVAGAREFITDGDNGFICRLRDVQSFIERIEYISNNRRVLENMGLKSRAIVKSKCSKEDYIKYLIDLSLNS